MEKLNSTIENICDWINNRLDDSMLIDEVNATSLMVSVLAELVAATKETDLEKRIADLEGQVQSQQTKNFVPETSEGPCKDLNKANNP